jgi:predicted MPP superfamily phosphohydrolase
VKISLTNANIAQITVTHHALQTISWMYIEKYVSVHNHRPIIKRARDREIDLIFTGIIFGNIFLNFFRIVPLF